MFKKKLKKGTIVDQEELESTHDEVSKGGDEQYLFQSQIFIQA